MQFNNSIKSSNEIAYFSEISISVSCGNTDIHQQSDQIYPWCLIIIKLPCFLVSKQERERKGREWHQADPRQLHIQLKAARRRFPAAEGPTSPRPTATRRCPRIRQIQEGKQHTRLPLKL